MKLARPLLITAGVLVVIFVTGLVLALTPSIQRWAVLRAAARQPGLKVAATGVSAGFSSLALKGVQVEQQGLKVNVERLEMDYSLWQLLFSDRLNVSHLSASGVVVDASRVASSEAGAAAAGAPVAGPGLLGRVQLPFELVLGDCVLAGRILLPGAAGQPPIETTWDIQGGKFAPGSEGSLRLTATVKNPAADAQVGSLHAQVSLRAVQTAQRGFSRISLTAVVDAEGRNISEQNQLKIETELVKESTGESYSANVDTVIRGAAGNLLTFRAALPAGQNDYSGQWTLKARNAQLEPFFLGVALPDFDVTGEGRLIYSPATKAVSLQGHMDAGASRLEVIDAAWRAIGPVKLSAQFDVTAAGGVARLRQMNVKLDGEKPVLELSASQAAEIDFVERRFRVGGMAAGEALNLRLHGVPVAWIAPFVTGVQLSGGTVAGQLSITGDSDRLLLRAVQPLKIDQLTIVQEGQTVLSKAALTLAMQAVLTDKDLQAKVSEFTLQTPLGDSFKVQASVAIPVAAKPSVSVQASYSADLPTLLAPWLPKAHVKATGDFDFTEADTKLEVRRMTTNVTTASGDLLLKVATLLPFNFDPATRRVFGEKKPVDLMQIGVGRLPLDWIPLSQSNAQLTGTLEPGDLVLSVDGEKISLRATAPLKLAGVSYAEASESLLSSLAVEMTPTFEMSGATSQVQTGDLTVRNAAGVVLLTSKGDVVQTPADGLRANLIFNLEVPALASQPVFAGAQRVSEGRASGEIRATVGAARQVEARLTVNGMVARDGGHLLPVANLSFRAIVQENGKIAVQAPLLLDRAGVRSDLNFALDVTPSGKDFAVDGKLSGEHVELSDALSVLGVFSAKAARATQDGGAAVGGVKVASDAVSAWSRFSGRLALDIKSVASGKEWAMTGLTGVVAINPAVISLQKLNASFSEKSQLVAKARLEFAAGPQPYQLTGDFSLTEFDAGKLFKVIEPTKPPTIEGLFTVQGQFKGSGETVERTIDRTHGQFDLTSRQGIFRGLQRTSGKVSMTSKAVELGASVLGSLFGSEKATKAAEKVAGQAYFVDQLAQSIGEFNYDQLSVKLVRDEALNLTMQDISLISPEIRLLGKGSVSYVAGKPLLEQPMNVSLSFAARGKVEQLLGKLRLVEGTKDEVGYAKAKEVITIGGTLSKPDPTGFFTKIASAKLNELLDGD